MSTSPHGPKGSGLKIRAYKLFIAHSSAEKTFVNRLIRELRGAGLPDPWYDAFQVDGATDDISQALTMGVRSAEWFALILSPTAANSHWLTYEIQAAKRAGVRGLALLYDSPDGYSAYLGNPHLANFLHGGQRKVIDFTNDFDRALTDLLLVVAPDVGLERDTLLTLGQIIEEDDPDKAERAMSHAALSPERFLSPLLDRVPDLRDDRKLRFRIEEAIASIGQPAIEPLLDFLFRQRDLPPHAQMPYPAVKPSHIGELGATGYEGSAAISMIRHMILTGGNRAWSAQLGAEYCLVALANQDRALRNEITDKLRNELVRATTIIAEHADEGEPAEKFLDVLRIAIETISAAATPKNLDDFLIYQFVTTTLWGSQGYTAKDKLAYYVIRALSSSASDEALNYLETMLQDPDIIDLYFDTRRAPNPWTSAFVPFAGRAVDRLLEFDGPSQVLTAIYMNLAQIRHPRGLLAALAWAADKESSSVDASDMLISVAEVGLPAISDKLLDLYATGAYGRFVDEPLAERIDLAAVIAARTASNQSAAADVCSALIDTDEIALQVELAKTIPASGVYKLYDVVRTRFGESPNDLLRAVTAISLSEHGILKSADAIIEELGYVDPERVAPLFAVALSYFGRAEAVAPLIPGLKASLLDGNNAMHELYASALTRIGSEEARAARRKWYRRI
jgi:hypothetical protein